MTSMLNPHFTHAFVRPVSPTLSNCQLSHLQRQPLDLTLAIQQYLLYVQALRDAGVRVSHLPPAPELPDAVFVEDTAVILDELAVVCRPAVPSRQAEVGPVADALQGLRPLHRIVAPGTLEGGDVLQLGRTLLVGRSQRTNVDGLRQLEKIVAAYGYHVVAVNVNGALHLKTAVTCPAPGLLLMNPNWIEQQPLAALDIEPCQTPASESFGANTLPVNDIVFVTASAPQTTALLRARGLEVQALDISELQKAEAGLTCLSLLQR